MRAFTDNAVAKCGCGSSVRAGDWKLGLLETYMRVSSVDLLLTLGDFFEA